MATTAKLQKDKPHAPRLTPRPTAASAARAARNATNRNLNLQPSFRQSPVRNTASPNAKNKSPQPRPTPKIEVMADVKASPKYEGTLPEDAGDNNNNNLSNMTIEETSEPPNVNDQDDLESFTNDSFDVKNSEHNVQDSDVRDIEDQDLTICRSRPETPSPSSRPLTPRSVQSSRPQTPHQPTRPSTPAHPAQRKTTTPTSRPNTPQKTYPPPTRPQTPSALPVPTPTRVHTPNIAPPPALKEEEDIKTLFNTKQRQFNRMKRELDMKQQAILEVFDGLRNLNKRMSQEGDGCAEGIQIQELVVFNVGDWSSEEIAQLCRDATATSFENNSLEVFKNVEQIDENSLAELGAKVSKVPSKFADLCIQAFTARQELIDWVKELVGEMEDGRGESLDRIARYNDQGLELCEALRELKSCADDAVDTVTEVSRRACQERSTLISVGETLVREIARLREDLEARAVIVNEMRGIRAETETAKSLEETRHQLEEERVARLATKEKLATAESQLRQTRIRVSKMDRQLREAEASIASLTGTVKSLEDQSRLREVHLEARARKLKESLKTGEVASNQIAQQRDMLQAEVQTLKEQIETATAQHKAAIQELNKEIKELKTALEEQRKVTQNEMEVRKALEESLAESHNIMEDLKAKNTELENSRPNPELPTEREMDLWAELQATKDTLRMTEDEVTACKREKVRFLETLTKISESENKVGMQQKLAAELLSKEEIIGKMQIQIRELTKNIKLNEQKVIQYEQYVRDLQAHNRAVANCQVAPNGISYQDLQQEIMNLRMSLLEAVHRNEELSEILAQKEQQLEQQDKTSRAQARVIKVREELINMLKNKETEQSRELSALQQDLEHRMKIVDEVNKQIAAKAEEIQELFATLENKQQQIHRLEKIVLALEEQQRRAQVQRTRHEKKIAALEHELAAGNRRERKFIFF
ncbi:uncharacterized protein LOC126366410 [Pectinophora gossypiella]|uniref:uncharacterized protein LOC126366410 n=1 Tax=Pectinophora gossypiella TaxID=13191 RepID=UPI00214F49CB|nr:uncharacterized protein LOC126366410 [Pectinophora gossypiella]